MDKQDRRTVRTRDGHAVELFYDNSFTLNLDDEVYSEYKKSLNRLADYEDTGLSPAEVELMKADNTRLHRLLSEVEEVIGKSSNGGDTNG